MTGGTPDALVASYLKTVRADAHPIVRALVEAVDETGLPFDCKHSYGMLMYALDGEWRHWVVAIGVSKAVVNLRLLDGDRIDDHATALRPGSSTLSTIDYASVDDVDSDVVVDYVRQAAALRRSDRG